MPSIEVSGRRVAFAADGAGSTVVALHASASTGSQWRSLSDHLARDHCIFAPDLPGYGGSEAVGCETGFSLGLEAETVFGLIAAWQEPVHLVGHSYGGAMALDIAARHPRWIKSLTLIEPTCFSLLDNGSDHDEEQLHAILALRSRMEDHALAGDAAGGMARFVDFWNGPGAWAALGDGQKARLAGVLGQVLGNFAATDDSPFHWRDWARVKVPTLAIMGAESPLVGQRMSEIVASSIRGARLKIVGAAGHMLPLTAPDTVNPLIAAHVRAADVRYDTRAARTAA